MIADIINVFCALLVVLYTCNNAPDHCLARVSCRKRRWIGKQSLKELDRHDLLPFKLDLINSSDSNILHDPQMRNVILRQGHPEPDALKPGTVFDKRLHFLMVEEIALFLSYKRIFKGEMHASTV